MEESASVDNSLGKDKEKYRKAKQGPLHLYSSWNLRQRKKLLSLLREYPLDAYKSIAEQIPNKDEQQVKEFILRMKERAKMKNKQKRLSREVLNRAPLEEWLEIATELVEFETIDSSTNLAKVMMVIANFEDFQTVKLEDYDGPDFKSIYKYMSQILQPIRQEDFIKLGPLECAIMLDMIHSLMEVLSDHDLSVQRNIMKWKYQLMEARNIYGHNVPECLKKASENDFSDFINEAKATIEQEKLRERKYMKRRANREPGTGSNDNKGKASTSAATKESSKVVPSRMSTSEVPTSSKIFSDLTEEDIEEVDESKNRVGLKRHKPGRKSALDPPEIPRTEIYLVMPPKGAEIVNYNPRTKKPVKERMDGKYQALNQEEQLINNDLNREITYDVHRTKFDQFLTKKPTRKMTDEEKRQMEGMFDVSEAKYESLLGSDDKQMQDIPAKKPKLYSLNPFCIPVPLLDIDADKKK